MKMDFYRERGATKPSDSEGGHAYDWNEWHASG